MDGVIEFENIFYRSNDNSGLVMSGDDNGYREGKI